MCKYSKKERKKERKIISLIVSSAKFHIAASRWHSLQVCFQSMHCSLFSEHWSVMTSLLCDWTQKLLACSGYSQSQPSIFSNLNF